MSLMETLEALKVSGAGDHMVMLYDNDAYNAEIIASYLGARLLNNEKCFYIDGDDDTDLLITYLSEFVDVKNVLEKGQLSIIGKSEAYSKDGKFEPDNMIQLLKELSLKAVEEGYEAFAISGEVSWVLNYEHGFDKIMEYEYKLNQEIFDAFPVSAICRYSLDKFSSEMIKNIIEVHPIIIWEGQIHDNPFYFDLVDTNEVESTSFQVQSMLERISSFTNTKSKFHQEIQAKEEAYNLLQMNVMKNMIIAMSSLLEIHDEYTKNHSENVARIGRKIAEAIGLSKEEISEIYFAGLVHDIGKTVIPYTIINKEEKLTEEEFTLIKKHSTYGYDALVRTDALKSIANIVLQHHERVDGNGYPLKNSGDEIPLGSRILCIADAYDAMVNNRPYRKAMGKKHAIDELVRCRGSQFDAKIIDAIIENKVLG